MWTGSRTRPHGFTFVEMMIVVAIVGGLSVILGAAIHSARRTEEYLDAVRRSAARGQEVVYEVSNLVGTSRMLFHADSDGVGAGYLTALDLSRDPPTATARLPVIETEKALDADVPGFPRTGNVLFFVTEGNDSPCVADAATGKIRSIDTHRFVCVYPHQSPRVVVPGTPPALDLVVWRSVAFPSYAQIMEIADPNEQRSVVRDLHRRYGHRMAWNPEKPVGEAFFALEASGNVAGVPLAAFVIPEDLATSDRGRLVYKNVQLARTDPNDPARRAVLSADDPAVWSPNGFEVKITGASVSRQVWLHLVVEAAVSGDRGSAVQPCTVIADARDY